MISVAILKTEEVALKCYFDAADAASDIAVYMEFGD